jgi:RNA polymerase sigma factor (sigma-70 family)
MEAHVITDLKGGGAANDVFGWNVASMGSLLVTAGSTPRRAMGLEDDSEGYGSISVSRGVGSVITYLIERFMSLVRKTIREIADELVKSGDLQKLFERFYRDNRLEKIGFSLGDLRHDFWLKLIGDSSAPPALVDSPPSYIQSSVHNFQADIIRRLDRARRRERKVAYYGHPDPLIQLLQTQGEHSVMSDDNAEGDIADSEARRRYLKLLETLSPKQRRVFQLFIVEGIPAAQVAQVMGVSVSWVYKLAAKAMDAMKTVLDQDGWQK